MGDGKHIHTGAKGTLTATFPPPVRGKTAPVAPPAFLPRQLPGAVQAKLIVPRALTKSASGAVPVPSVFRPGFGLHDHGARSTPKPGLANAVAQAKLAIPQPMVPPVFQPHAGSKVAQAKLAGAVPAFARAIPVRAAARPPAAVIQRASRDKMAQSHNYIVPAQIGWYQQHVTLRISHCVHVILKVWHVLHEAKKTHAASSLRRMASVVSPTAEAQVGVGNYGATGGKLDAAHLMNTTVRSDLLLSGMTVSSTQEAMIRDLYTMSGATTMQLKSDNVGPDKVIDTCMTEFAAYCATKCDGGVAPVDSATLVTWLTGKCNERLTASTKSANANYVSAIAGVAAATHAGHDVAFEMDAWTKDYK